MNLQHTSPRRLLVLTALLALVVASLALVPGLASSARPDRGAPRSGRKQLVEDDDARDAPLTIADTDAPTVGKLDPDLRAAVADATEAARADGITVQITSGWRSVGHQQRLFEKAIRTYGSEAEARRWVATPNTSAHVRGEAVDVGPTDAAYWMAQHGARFGLCQVYANEVWHYELLTSPGGTCPTMRTDGAS